MTHRHGTIVQSLIIALGILGGTAASLFVGDALPASLAGPGILALFGGLARWNHDRLEGRPSLGPALLVACYALGFGAIVAIIAPSSVPLILPVLGAGVAMQVTPRQRCWKRPAGA